MLTLSAGVVALVATLSILINGLLVLRMSNLHTTGRIAQISLGFAVGIALLVGVGLASGVLGVLQDGFMAFQVISLVAGAIGCIMVLRGGRIRERLGHLHLSWSSAAVLAISMAVSLPRLIQAINGLPGYDALEATLPVAKVFFQTGSIPLNSPVYLQNGIQILVPPGTSIVYAYYFVASEIPQSFGLSFLQDAVLLAFGGIGYSLARIASERETAGIMAFVLIVAMPFWNSYFSALLEYPDLLASFLGASTILGYLVFRDSKTLSAYLILSVLLLGTATSKINGVIIVFTVFLMAVMSFTERRRIRVVLGGLSLMFYATLAVAFIMTAYTTSSITGGPNLLLFLAVISTGLFGLSVLPLLGVHQPQLGNLKKAFFLVVPLASLAWYFKDFVQTGALFVPVAKHGAETWAEQYLSSSSGLGQSATPYVTAKALDFIAYFPLWFILPVFGLAILGGYFKKNDVVVRGLMTWVLVGFAFYVGVLSLGDTRYTLYFIPGVLVLASVGLIEASKRVRRGRLDVAASVFVSCLLVALAFTTFFQTPVASPETSPYYQIANQIALQDRPGVTLSFGTTGAYFFSNVNALNLVYPDTLGLLKPPLQSDIPSAYQFIHGVLDVQTVALPSELNTFWYGWFQNLACQLPGIRLLENPRVFTVASFDKYGWYVLDSTNASLAPFGILDVSLVGDRCGQQSSLFLNWDYGNDQINVAEAGATHLAMYLYFSDSTINSSSFARVNGTLTLTRFDNFGNSTTVSNQTENFDRVLTLQRVVNMTLTDLTGDPSSQYTAFSLKSINLQITFQDGKSYMLELAPLNPSGTWITYLPAKGLWLRSHANLVEVAEYAL